MVHLVLCQIGLVISKYTQKQCIDRQKYLLVRLRTQVSCAADGVPMEFDYRPFQKLTTSLLLLLSECVMRFMPLRCIHKPQGERLLLLKEIDTICQNQLQLKGLLQGS